MCENNPIQLVNNSVPLHKRCLSQISAANHRTAPIVHVFLFPHSNAFSLFVNFCRTLNKYGKKSEFRPLFPANKHKAEPPKFPRTKKKNQKKKTATNGIDSVFFFPRLHIISVKWVYWNASPNTGRRNEFSNWLGVHSRCISHIKSKFPLLCPDWRDTWPELYIFTPPIIRILSSRAPKIYPSV